eukprot:4063207-Pleurochrysis_carterae.AAC.3
MSTGRVCSARARVRPERQGVTSVRASSARSRAWCACVRARACVRVRACVRAGACVRVRRHLEGQRPREHRVHDHAERPDVRLGHGVALRHRARQHLGRRVPAAQAAQEVREGNSEGAGWVSACECFSLHERSSGLHGAGELRVCVSVCWGHPQIPWKGGGEGQGQESVGARPSIGLELEAWN